MATDTSTSSELLARIKNMGSVEVIKIAALHFDHHYQRDLRNTFAQKIANQFNTLALGFPLVSRRADGTMYVVNGQHRVAAANMLGLTEMVCLVVTGLTQEQEADLRISGNVALGESTLETFRAKVTAKYPEALDIVEICNRFDTRINETFSTHTGLNAVSTVEYIYNRDRGLTLVRVFEVIRDAWGKINPEVASANMLKGLAWFLDAHGNEYNRSRLIERLQAVGPAALGTMMRTHRAALGGTEWLNLYRSVVEIYNERLSEQTRLKWKTRGWGKARKADLNEANTEWMSTGE